MTDEEKQADDEALRSRLKEFGRSPAYSTTSEYDNEIEVKIVNNVTDLNYFSNASEDIYSLTDIDSFFDDLNKNFYISDDNLLNSDNIKDLTSISSSFIDFTKIYNDQRDISEINLIITGERFTAIANRFTDYSIPLAFSGSTNTESSDFGNAKLIQSRFATADGKDFIEIVILVEITVQDEVLCNILPSHLFLTAKLDLTTVDGNGNHTYPIDLYINNFDETETDDAMHRIELLENAFGFDSGLSLDEVKSNLSTEISSVLDNYINIFDGFDIKEDYVNLHNVYEYITNGTIEADGTYNREKPMFETYGPSSSKCVYGIENGKVGYYDENKNFILINAVVDGNVTVATPIRNENNILGYYDNGDFKAIQTLPEVLMNDLRNFGKSPEENLITIAQGSNFGHSILGYDGNRKFIGSQNENVINLYQPYGVKLSDVNDYFFNLTTDENGTYYQNNTSEVLDLLNMNFYIHENKKIGISDIKNENVKFTLDNSMLNFAMLYKDERSLADMSVNIVGKHLASFIHDMYPNGISTEENGNYSAQVAEVHIYTKELSENTDSLLNGYTTLKTILRVKLSNNDLNGANILPEYLYMTVFTVIDPDAGNERFSCEVVINNFGYTDENVITNQFESTYDFINRLNVLKNNFNVNFDFDLEEIKTTIKDKLKALFENSLQAFGNIKYENDSLIIPNLYEFLTDGQMVDNEQGQVEYKYGEEILADSAVIDHTMYELDGTKTSPSLLRERLKELGKAYEGSIPVKGTDKYYNDNAYTTSDESNFYDDMQALYFLKNKPDFATLQDSTILDNLSTDIESVFNLNGKTGAVYGDDIRQNYLDFGLYNYMGEQADLRLSDKALASLIGSQHSIDLTSNMMLKGLTISSVKLYYKDAYSMTIEITIKAITKDKLQNELNAMPDYFYITTITERTVDLSGNATYSSDIALNGFTTSEFESFLANVAHIEEYSSLGITENFKSAEIANAVEYAIRETLDNKLSDYIDNFGLYENNSVSGVGYIQFKSIYNKLLSMTGATTGNESDMQSLIVKLHNDNAYLSKNKYDESNALNLSDLLARSYFTDREFAYMLNGLLKSDTETNYITVEQLVILKGINPEYNGYVDLIKNINPEFVLTNEDNGYFLITVAINTSEITSDVKIAPETIHISLLMDSEGNFVKYNNGTSDVSIKFIQDFTASEQALFMSIFNDANNTIDVDAKIEAKVKEILALSTGELNQSDNFDQYCGYMGNK